MQVVLSASVALQSDTLAEWRRGLAKIARFAPKTARIDRHATTAVYFLTTTPTISATWTPEEVEG